MSIFFYLVTAFLSGSLVVGFVELRRFGESELLFQLSQSVICSLDRFSSAFRMPQPRLIILKSGSIKIMGNAVVRLTERYRSLSL